MESKLHDEADVFRRMACIYEKNTLIIYDCKNEKFTYPDSIEEQFMARFDDRPLWEIMLEDKVTSELTAELFKQKIQAIAKAEVPEAYFAECMIKDANGKWKWHRAGVVSSVPKEIVTITVTDIDNEVSTNCRLARMSNYDELTGIFNRNAFGKQVEEIAQKDEAGMQEGKYALVYFDVLRFKAINDMFGMQEGDRLLKYIANTLVKIVQKEDIVCRLGSDKFMFFTHASGENLEMLVEELLERIKNYKLSFTITCNIGIYVTNEGLVSVNSMIDRAVLAQSEIKGSYTKRYHYYTETLRNDMLSEQEIAGMMVKALEDKQFVVYYQPQYNHTTGTIIGSEALVRWNHPERGLISPGVFIPIFEKNGFITKLDFYVFEQTCSFLRRSIDEGLPTVPISTNFSRYDIFQPDFVERLEEIRRKYNIPVNYLRVEITESVAVVGSGHVNDIMKKLHGCGYVIEMDDFGSGYSSLNVLKDIDLDMIKLDMLFMVEQSESNKGGTILSSIVRMAKWLGMPVIAEGVETVDQADFLRSIGCEYIQGYLYSKPLPEEQYEKLLDESTVGIKKVPKKDLIEILNAYNFWDSKSQETLIFNNYVGGAAIFEYHHNQEVEILRVNKKYLQEIGMNLTEKDLIESDPLAKFDEKNKKIYMDMLERAITSTDEEECETWRVFLSSDCGKEWICVRSNVRMIGQNGDSYLFYAMIRNITKEKEYYQKMEEQLALLQQTVQESK